jgi:hypothetical protein
MKIIATRDSVAMGDDINAPHSKNFEFSDDLPILDVLLAILRSGYLASIQGGKATWSAHSNIPLAVLAQQWDCLKSLISEPITDLDVRNSILHIHFSYHCQVDPEIFYKTVRDPIPEDGKLIIAKVDAIVSDSALRKMELLAEELKRDDISKAIFAKRMLYIFAIVFAAMVAAYLIAPQSIIGSAYCYGIISLENRSLHS